ncbi:MAG: hypothetical protein DKT66_22020 [Candidatus Melainabacteria bacterium]|nr:MAG: hypothetical protein DKT66_22020 [Candidatus Melainabacteria bacterium]
MSDGFGKRRTMSSVNKVLNQLVSSLNLDRRLKEHTLLGLWPTIVGEPFATKSRPLFIDHEGNIVISVSEAAVGQELSLMRSQLVKKMRIAGNGLGVEIRGIRFDMKHFYKKEEIVENRKAVEATNQQRLANTPGPEELASIILTPEEEEDIKALKIRLTAADGDHEKVHDRIVALYEKELRARKWMEANVSTQCQTCKQPTPMLYGSQGLCSMCFFESQVRPAQSEKGA